MKHCLVLLASGLVTEATYLALTLRLPWWRYGGTLQSWHRLLGSGLGAFWLCMGGALLLLAAYAAGWLAVRRLEACACAIQRRLVWLFALTYAATLFWLMPFTSDLFNYLNQAHLLTDLGENPLLESARAVNEGILARGGRADPLLSTYATAYSETPSIYGPAWLLVSAPATLGRLPPAFGLAYLKGLACLAFLSSTWFVGQIVERLRPGSSSEALYLFSWSPLVLLMSVGDGHNDVVMMAAVLLSVWLMLRGAWVPAFGALAWSALLKYIGALFLPLFLLYVLCQSKRQGSGSAWMDVLQAGSVAGFVVALLSVPVGSVEWGLEVLYRLLRPENWALSRTGPPVATIPRELQEAIYSLLAWPPSLALAGGLLVFAVAYLWLAGRLAYGLRKDGLVAQRLRAEALLNASFSVSLLIFVLGAARSQPWHLIWPASLAGLSAKRWAWPVVSLLSAVMLLSQIWVEWGTPGPVDLFMEVV